MKIFEYRCELWLPRNREDIFPFFTKAANLQTITPDWLDFQIERQQPEEMEEGTLIDYRLKVRGIPLRWRTRINVWEPPHRFVDEQIRGPYRLWIHEHRFEPADNGTLCLDHVRYAVPGGTLVNKLFVQRDVQRIFDHRQKVLARMFGTEFRENSELAPAGQKAS